MAELFGSEEMAAGYAKSRPPVHPRVIEKVGRELGWMTRFRRALDVGCGAGVSTKALVGHAEECIGLEPLEAMLKWAPRVAPWASFVAGAAEAIPLCEQSVDVITAAGSLNYTRLELFFPEAARVLTSDGVLVVYDFSAGRSFRDSACLDDWFERFVSRYPVPRDGAQTLSPAVLQDAGREFRMVSAESFAIGVTMARAFYVDYMMTETNVASAVQGGVSGASIRSWCEETLAEFWDGGEREVVFRGYYACMTGL